MGDGCFIGVTAHVLSDKDFSTIYSLQFIEVDRNSDNNVQYSPLAYHQRCATLTLNLIASTDINKIIKDNATLKKLYHPALAK